MILASATTRTRCVRPFLVKKAPAQAAKSRESGLGARERKISVSSASCAAVQSSQSFRNLHNRYHAAG